MTEIRRMSEQESAVSLAAEEADERTQTREYDGPGVWHMHFLDALSEQGWVLVHQPSEAEPIETDARVTGPLDMEALRRGGVLRRGE